MQKLPNNRDCEDDRQSDGDPDRCCVIAHAYPLVLGTIPSSCGGSSPALASGRSFLNFSRPTHEPNAPIPDGWIALGHAGPSGTSSCVHREARHGVYSKPQAKSEFLLPLPEVRVHVPALKDTAGFCQFKLIYKIVDRENPELPATGWARCVSIDQLVPN